MLLRILAIIFGIAFIFVGVAGFIPVFVTDHLLFYWFEISVVHNIVHLVIGVLAIMSATSPYYARLFFKVLGIVYILSAIIGFWHGQIVFVHVNTADSVACLVIGVAAIILGFFVATAERE